MDMETAAQIRICGIILNLDHLHHFQNFPYTLASAELSKHVNTYTTFEFSEHSKRKRVLKSIFIIWAHKQQVRLPRVGRRRDKSTTRKRQAWDKECGVPGVHIRASRFRYVGTCVVSLGKSLIGERCQSKSIYATTDKERYIFRFQTNAQGFTIQCLQHRRVVRVLF